MEVTKARIRILVVCVDKYFLYARNGAKMIKGRFTNIVDMGKH